MLKKNIILSRLLPVALAVGIGLGLGLQLPAQDAPAWMGKDNGLEEYNMFKASQDAKTDAERLTALDTWANAFPDSNYKTTRDDFYLFTYGQLKDYRKHIDKAKEILQTRPNQFDALRALVSDVRVMQPQPPPAADLATAEMAAQYMLDHADEVFAASNRPPTYDEASWPKVRQPMLDLSNETLAWVAVQSGDPAVIDAAVRKFLGMTGPNALYTYQLAQALRGKDNPNIPEATFYFMRAANLKGEGALPENQTAQIDDYAKKLYESYSGLKPGDPGYAYDKLVAIAVNDKFMPSDWEIESAQARVQREFAEEEAWANANPDWDFWNRGIVEPIEMAPDPAALFEMTYKDAGIPGGANGLTHFRARVVYVDPKNPNVLALYVGDPSKKFFLAPNVMLTVKPGIPEGLNVTPGTEIEIAGVPKTMTVKPFVFNMEADLEAPGLKNAVQPLGGSAESSAPAGQ